MKNSENIGIFVSDVTSLKFILINKSIFMVNIVFHIGDITGHVIYNYIQRYI